MKRLSFTFTLFSTFWCKPTTYQKVVQFIFILSDSNQSSTEHLFRPKNLYTNKNFHCIEFSMNQTRPRCTKLRNPQLANYLWKFSSHSHEVGYNNFFQFLIVQFYCREGFQCRNIIILWSIAFVYNIRLYTNSLQPYIVHQLKIRINLPNGILSVNTTIQSIEIHQKAEINKD